MLLDRRSPIIYFVQDLEVFQAHQIVQLTNCTNVAPAQKDKSRFNDPYEPLSDFFAFGK